MSYDPNKRLAGVHPHLCSVVARAAELTDIPFIVTEGVRTVERQKVLFAKGASKTMNSRHIPKGGYGHAVDLAAYVDLNGDGRAGQGEIRWDWPLYAKLAGAMKAAAAELKIPIVWGGDWVSWKDGPHFELDRRYYP